MRLIKGGECSGILVSVDSGTHLHIEQHILQYVTRVHDDLDLAHLERVVSRSTCAVLEGEEILVPPGSEVVRLLHLGILVLLVVLLTSDISAAGRHFGNSNPLVSLGLAEVSNSNLAANSSSIQLTLSIIFVGNPLVNNLTIDEEGGGHFKSYVKEPSVISACFSVKLVAADKSLPTEFLSSVEVGEEVGKSELVLLLQQFINGIFVFKDFSFFVLSSKIGLGLTESDLVLVLACRDW
jgi:hypothetical protein